MSRPREICHVITGLQLGGAETMLWKVLGAMDASEWRPRVLSLRDRGVIGPRIEDLGIPVAALGLGAGGLATLTAPIRLRRSVGVPTPDLFQGWMYHGNLAASFAASRRGPPVVWNVRQTFAGYGKERLLTRWVIRASARISASPARIIYNSRASAAQHEAIGFDPRRTVIIPNGFDTERFRPSPSARAALRARLGLGPAALIVGQVARYHPMKDHAGFLRVAGRLASGRPNLSFVLAGKGIDGANAELAQVIREAGLAARVHLVGEEGGVAELLAGLDILCSPSLWGEGFPNVLGEAMASGIPCVATDVGDAAWVLGRGGVSVPPGDGEALMRALANLIDASADARTAIGEEGRKRVVAEFTLPAIVERYRLLYTQILSESAVR